MMTSYLLLRTFFDQTLHHQMEEVSRPQRGWCWTINLIWSYSMIVSWSAKELFSQPSYIEYIWHRCMSSVIHSHLILICDFYIFKSAPMDDAFKHDVACMWWMLLFKNILHSSQKTSLTPEHSSTHILDNDQWWLKVQILRLDIL